MENNNFSIIIPVAGIGKRMKSYGPKALIRLNSLENVLGRQLNILQELYPKNDIVIVSGFEDEKIREFLSSWKTKRVLGSKDIKIVTNKNYSTTNVAKSIALATEYCDKNNYLIVYGDLVFNKETLSEINWDKSGVLLDTKNQLDKTGTGVILNQDSEIASFCYDSKIKWSQIAFLLEKDMELFLDLIDSRDRYRYFSFEIFNLMLEKIKLHPYFNEKAKIVELDHSEDIPEARKIVEEQV